MRSGITCLLMLTVGACCFPEERQIPEPPAKPDGGTPAYTREGPPPYPGQARDISLEDSAALKATAMRLFPPAVKRDEFLNYCASFQVRNCWTGCSPSDPWAGWWCDRPQASEVQLFDGTVCKIINGTYTDPGMGFPAGGLHDHAAWFYPASPLMVRTGPSTAGAFWYQKCWLGDTYTIFWSDMEFTLQLPPRSTAVWPG